MKKNNITELFMAKAGNDYTRCFYGSIKRNIDKNNESIISGKIKVNDGHVFAQGKSQNELGDKLDELVLFVLDKNLHKPTGITSIVFGNKLFHN